MDILPSELRARLLCLQPRVRNSFGPDKVERPLVGVLPLDSRMLCKRISQAVARISLLEK